jgi:antitoxin VapB
VVVDFIVNVTGIQEHARVMAMRHTAKLFMNGRSQAVRLPANYRFDCEEVYIRRDPETGDVIISRKPGSWEDFFEMIDSIDVPEDFMSERGNELPQERNLF